MILMWLVACGTPTPPPAPVGPTAIERGEQLALAVRRAGHSEEASCAAVNAAVQLAPDWKDEPVPLGLTRDAAGRVSPDWRELALASGPGNVANAIVTVGGLDRDPACADLAWLSRWIRRVETLERAPACMRDSAVLAADRAVQGILDRPCVCGAPDPAGIPAIAAGLEKLGLAETAARARAWPDQPTFVACPAPPTEPTP